MLYPNSRRMVRIGDLVKVDGSLCRILSVGVSKVRINAYFGGTNWHPRKFVEFVRRSVKGMSSK